MRLFVLGIVLALYCSAYSLAQFDEILKKAGETLAHRDTSGLTDDKIIAGLKQACRSALARLWHSRVDPTVF